MFILAIFVGLIPELANQKKKKKKPELVRDSHSFICNKWAVITQVSSNLIFFVQFDFFRAIFVLHVSI